MEIKTCIKCNIEKKLECFPDTKSYYSGKVYKRNVCRSCRYAAEDKDKKRLRDKRRNHKRRNTLKYKIWSKEYHIKKYETDIEYKIKYLLRRRFRLALKNNAKSGSAVKDLGCSIEEFKVYIESKFQPGMSWDNHGYGDDKWHIDHIIPLSSFDLTNKNELIKACHYTNLQPLWQKDNLKKGAKICLTKPQL